MAEIINYTDDNIRTMDGVEHIRKRPGMYIGRLGNGDDQGDGIYVLLKEETSDYGLSRDACRC